MYASSHPPTHFIPSLTLLRWCARAGAIVLTLGWLGYAVAELFHTGFYVPPALAYQGTALAVVFLGYAVGWQRELAGSLMVIAGIAAFFVITVLAVGTWPQMAAAWFAAPGVLYFEAWRREQREVRQAHT
jgi:hypothetical protein